MSILGRFSSCGAESRRMGRERCCEVRLTCSWQLIHTGYINVHITAQRIVQAVCNMPSNNLQPGPHDPYNAGSVRLAEATMIRLNLPGLAAQLKEDTTPCNSRATGSRSHGEAAAAKEKARRKLLKLESIAQQADQAHSCVIIDKDIWNGIGTRTADSTGTSKSSAGHKSVSASAISPSGGGAGNADQSAGRRHNSASSPKAGREANPGSTDVGTTTSVRSVSRFSGDGARSGARTTMPRSPQGGGKDRDSPGKEGPRSVRSALGCSDKPHVPIWERQPATPPEEKRSAAATHRVYQPVTIKTFSPTLGSLAAHMSQDNTPSRHKADSVKTMTVTHNGKPKKPVAGPKAACTVAAAVPMSTQQHQRDDSFVVPSQHVGPPSGSLSELRN